MSTGKHDFLRSINSDISEIKSSVDKLKQISDTASRQRSDVDSLSNLVNEILQQANREIDYAKLKFSANSKSDRPIEIFQKEKLVTLASLINKIDETENQLLTERKLERANNFKELSGLINLFYCVLVLLLLISFIVIYRNTRARNRAESEIKDLNANLEKRVEKRLICFWKRKTNIAF